jgi:hypothetical protein
MTQQEALVGIAQTLLRSRISRTPMLGEITIAVGQAARLLHISEISEEIAAIVEITRRMGVQQS